MTHRVTRRTFLKTTAAAATITLLPMGLATTYAANNKVNLGIIGTGGMGQGNRQWFKRLAEDKNQPGGANNIVALCDVDRGRVEEATKDHPGAKTYVDYRKMLEEVKEIDAVMVSTPDHHHFPASMLAMSLGKGVDTEKPLTHSVWEARQLGIAAAKYKVATQMDNEGHASEGLRKCVEWVRSGAIGKVHEVHIFTDRPIWPQGIKERPPTKPVPKNLEWDLWIGPAPYRDYHEHLHAFSWRGWWDFGTGALGDMGCHFWDSAFWALTLGHPTRIEAEHEGNSVETGPIWSTVTYHFPARSDSLPPVKVTWWDGRKPRKDGNETKYDVPNLPPRPEELEPGREFPRNGSMFVGEKGKILVVDTSSPRLIPEEKMKAYKQPEPFLPRVSDHKVEWLEAVRGGKPASSNFTDYGGPLAEVVILGNLAIRAGKTIEWDGRKLEATNCPEASQYVRRAYRKGWDFS
ncbi:MAG TPA: Gfo/Idh/MocA family oxidoreductase [Phycisphaerae bacterium]|nr:Gfo/Idh/MocA family oxidoreductase [Phycisphaerae bacterium]